jgi:hypothetical protein
MPSLTNLKTLKTVTEGNYTESVITFQISGGKNFGTDEKKASFRNEDVPMIFTKSFLNAVSLLSLSESLLLNTFQDKELSQRGYFA